MEKKIRVVVPPVTRITYTMCLQLVNYCVFKYMGSLWIPKILLAIISFFTIDWIWKSYTVDSEGIHQKWFFHTDHFRWDSFSDVFLICMNETAKVKNPQYCICFDRGLLHRILPSWDRDLHWFKFVMFELEESENIRRLGNMRWVVNRTEMLSFMSELGIDVEQKLYGGFFGDHG